MLNKKLKNTGGQYFFTKKDISNIIDSLFRLVLPSLETCNMITYTGIIQPDNWKFHLLYLYLFCVVPSTAYHASAKHIYTNKYVL